MNDATIGSPAVPEPVRELAFTGRSGHADVTVVVVTYNSAADLPPLLDALRPETLDQRVRVVIADNASDDDTLAVARAHADVCALATGGNLGYAGAINVAMSAVGDSDSIFILNPDARVERGALAALRHRQSVTGAGVVAPMIVDADGSRYPSLRREPTVRRSLGDAALGRVVRNRPAWLTETVHRAGEYATAHPIDWASGAALLVHMDAVRAAGPWDEQFFLYSEETDFQRRVRDTGMQIWYEPDARVHHAERGSGFSLALDRLIAVNRVRYARKHMGRARAGVYRGTVALHHLARSSGSSYRAIFRTVARVVHVVDAAARAAHAVSPRSGRRRPRRDHHPCARRGGRPRADSGGRGRLRRRPRDRGDRRGERLHGRYGAGGARPPRGHRAGDRASLEGGSTQPRRSRRHALAAAVPGCRYRGDPDSHPRHVASTAGAGHPRRAARVRVGRHRQQPRRAFLLSRPRPAGDGACRALGVPACTR